MPQLYPSILPGADHSHDPLRGDGEDKTSKESDKARN